MAIKSRWKRRPMSQCPNAGLPLIIVNTYGKLILLTSNTQWHIIPYNSTPNSSFPLAFDTATQLVADYGSHETIVSFNPGSKAFFSKKQEECPSLTIASGFSIDIIDEFVTTFLRFEQQERDRMNLPA